MNTNRVNANGAYNYSLRTTTVPTNPEELEQLMKTRSKDGFATSAYWGATGLTPAREPDDVSRRVPHRFEGEISRKLMPLGKEITSIPRTLDYTLVGLHHFTDDGNTDTGGLNAAQLKKLYEGDATITDTANGPSIKPRFLTMDTTTQRMPGKFDDDVLKALQDGKDKEEAARRELEDLKKRPFVSRDPNPYRLTSDDYCDMTPISSHFYRVTDPMYPDEKLEVYKSRYNNVEREGPKRRERTFKIMQRERNVDLGALRKALDDSHKDAIPRGYKPYSAKDWMSTTHREHANYDTDAAASMNEMSATYPVRNVNYALTSAHEESYQNMLDRHRTRHDGDWGTEYADNYEDRFSKAEICKDYAGKSIFDIEYGIYTMDHHFHHPRNDTSLGEELTPSTVVPGQHKPMSVEPLHAKNALPMRK